MIAECLIARKACISQLASAEIQSEVRLHDAAGWYSQPVREHEYFPYIDLAGLHMVLVTPNAQKLKANHQSEIDSSTEDGLRGILVHFG